ncbi:hypothetical protein [Streptomyces sp. NPDC000878]
MAEVEVRGEGEADLGGVLAGQQQAQDGGVPGVGHAAFGVEAQLVDVGVRQVPGGKPC